MIISTYENEKRAANVCKQGNEWVVMCYEDNEYLKDIVTLNENQAELIADQWLNYEPV